MSTPDPADAALIVSFYEKRIVNPKSPLEPGPIKVYCRILIPGDKNNVHDQPATDENKARFPDQWDRFQRKIDQRPDGTDLEQWPGVHPEAVQFLKANNVFTVEQLASVSDNMLSKLGAGARTLREKAIKWVNQDSVLELDALRVRLAAAEARLAEIEPPISPPMPRAGTSRKATVQ